MSNYTKTDVSQEPCTLEKRLASGRAGPQAIAGRLDDLGRSGRRPHDQGDDRRDRRWMFCRSHHVVFRCSRDVPAQYLFDTRRPGRGLSSDGIPGGFRDRRGEDRAQGLQATFAATVYEIENKGYRD